MASDCFQTGRKVFVVIFSNITTVLNETGVEELYTLRNRKSSEAGRWHKSHLHETSSDSGPTLTTFLCTFIVPSCKKSTFFFIQAAEGRFFSSCCCVRLSFYVTQRCSLPNIFFLGNYTIIYIL